MSATMPPQKIVLKCGNFAVLADLHIRPLGGRGDASWFTTEHVEEVTVLVQDAVCQRVRQYTDSLHNRGHTKPKKDLAPATAFYKKGASFNIAANFLKRHLKLRCIVKQRYGELRVFPERYVVCVSCPEDASAHHGNPSLAANKSGEQSRSEYFSSAGETREPLNSSAKTKRTALRKIARQVAVSRDLRGPGVGKKHLDLRAGGENREGNRGAARVASRSREEVSTPVAPASPASAALPADLGARFTRAGNRPPDSASAVSSQLQLSRERSGGSERCAKATRPGGTACEPAERPSRTSPERDRPPPQSTALPVSECDQTTLEVELLTPGKRARAPPLASNNTEQTNQNRPAASLRGLSVKPASSGCSISSRSTLGEEGNENAPRASRLRRQKRS